MAKRWIKGRTTKRFEAIEEREAPKIPKAEPPDAPRKRRTEPFFQPCVFCGSPTGLCLGTKIIQRSTHLCHRCFSQPAGKLFRQIDCNRLVEFIGVIDDVKLIHVRNPRYVSPTDCASTIVRYMRSQGVPCDGIAPGRAQIAVPMLGLPPEREGRARESPSQPRPQLKASELDEPVVF